MEAWISVAFGVFSLAEVELVLRFVAQGQRLEAEVETGSETEAATETGFEAEVEAEVEAGPEEVYEVLLCVLVYCYSPRLT